jgi:hypothetical protein
MRIIKLVTGFLGKVAFDWLSYVYSVESVIEDKELLFNEYKATARKYHELYHIEKNKLEKANAKYNRLSNLFKILWKSRN